jgi:hypothetical protein
MEQANTSLTIKISGKNQRGEQFQEVARLEAFGNFGVLIHTLQPLDLGDVMHIAGNNNKPIACGEVIWVRGGDSPSVEVLLHRNTNIDEVVSVNESVVPQKTAMLPNLASGATRPLQMKSAESLSGKTSSLSATSLSGAKSVDTTKSIPSSSNSNVETENVNEGETVACSSCNKANPITNKSCKYCGSYMSRGTSTLRSNTLGKIVQDVKAAHSGGASTESTDSTASQIKSGATSISGKTPSLSQPRLDTNTSSTESISSSTSSVRPSRPSRNESAGNVARMSAQDRKKLEALAQQQKIGLVALVIFVLLFAATFLPIGSSLEPSPLDVVEQTGCLHVNSLKRQATDLNKTGELEYWTQDKNKTTVQFIRKAITAGNAVTEVDNLVNAGAEVHGYWCPKAESKLVTQAQLPKNLTGLWAFKPTGARAKEAGDFTLQLVGRSLVIKEKVTQTEVDRTKDIKQATYFTGQQKLNVILNDVSGAKVNAASLREFNFYLPSGQDPLPSVEGVLSNTVRPFYTGEYKDSSGQTGVKDILMYIFGGLAGLSLLYLGVNFYQTRSL